MQSSALDNLGPHLLGRIPSPPDARDFRLGDFLPDSDASIRDAAVAELKQTSVGYNAFHGQPPGASTHWAKALALLAQIGAPGPPPPPPPPPPPSPPSGDVVWPDPETVLDQGQFGTCVGNGWAQWGNTLPVDDKFNEKDARAIYYEATVLDGSPDNPDVPGGGQQGASTRSGVKAMQNRGRLTNYAFAATIDEVIAWLRTKGPVVFGTQWYNAMFTPDANGYVRPSGADDGGHEYVAVGHLPGEDAIKFLNSWSRGWGLGGYFKMKVADVRTVFAVGGEAVAAVELP